MSRAVGAIATVVVIGGVAWAGTAWYTGSKVEENLLTSIEQANVQINAMAPESGIRIALQSFERGVFSSNAQYSITIPPQTEGQPPAAPAASDKTEVLVIADHIEHGPFPWSRLKSGHLGPVMATSNFKLERNALVDGWFAATKDVSPLSGVASLGYGGDVDGYLRLEPVDHTDEAGSTVNFSGLDLNYDVTRKTGVTKVDGKIDTLRYKGLAEGQPVAFDMSDLAIESDMNNMFVGESEVTVKQIALIAPGYKFDLSDYVQRMNLKQSENKLSGSMSYKVGQVRIDDRDVASGEFVLNIANFDAAAVEKMATLYQNAAMREGQTPPGVTPPNVEADQEAFIDAVTELLAGNPSLSIDPILVKTKGGEGRFTLNVELTKPASPEMTLEAIVGQTIRKLDARLAIDKPVVADLLTHQYVTYGMAPEQAAQQAGSEAEMMSGMAVQMGVARLEGETVVSTLNYADDTVDFNGQKMPVEEFAGVVFSMVLGGGMGGVMDPELDESLDEEAAPELSPQGGATPAPMR